MFSLLPLDYHTKEFYTQKEESEIKYIQLRKQLVTLMGNECIKNNDKLKHGGVILTDQKSLIEHSLLTVHKAKAQYSKIRTMSVDSNLKVNSLFKTKTNYQNTYHLLKLIKKHTLDIIKCLKLNFSCISEENWSQYYRALVFSINKTNSSDMINGIDFAFIKSLKEKLNDRLSKLKRGMKVSVYEELKFFGESDNEIYMKSSQHQIYLRNNGIEVVHKEKDYSRLRVMMLEYVRIEDFAEGLVVRNCNGNRYLVEDRDLFGKHLKELTEVDDLLRGREHQVMRYYEELKFRFSEK